MLKHLLAISLLSSRLACGSLLFLGSQYATGSVGPPLSYFSNQNSISMGGSAEITINDTAQTMDLDINANHMWFAFDVKIPSGGTGGGTIYGRLNQSLNYRGIAITAGPAGTINITAAHDESIGPKYLSIYASGLSLNTWHRVFISSDGTAANTHIYFDGADQSLTTISDTLAGTTTVSGIQAQLGHATWSGGTAFNGNFDELAIGTWVSSPPSAAVFANANNQPVNVCGVSGIISEYRFEASTDTGIFFVGDSCGDNHGFWTSASGASYSTDVMGGQYGSLAPYASVSLANVANMDMKTNLVSLGNIGVAIGTAANAAGEGPDPGYLRIGGAGVGTFVEIGSNGNGDNYIGFVGTNGDARAVGGWINPGTSGCMDYWSTTGPSTSYVRFCDDGSIEFLGAGTNAGTLSSASGTNITLSPQMGAANAVVAISGSVSISSSQTTINGSAGTAVCSQPEMGATYKKVVCYFSGYSNNGTQNYTFPAAFSNTPIDTFSHSGITPTISTTTVSFNANNQTGWVFIEGY